MIRKSSLVALVSLTVLVLSSVPAPADELEEVELEVRGMT